VRTSATVNGKPGKKVDRLLADSTTVGEAAFLILHAELEKFLALEPQVITSEDPETVHQVRVAARRMRAAMKTLAAFMPKAVSGLEPELRWLFRHLGDVRDLDVELAALEEWVKAHEGQTGMAEIFGRLQKERSKKKAVLIEQMQSSRHEELVEKLKSGIRKGPPTAGLGASPLLAVAPDLIVRHGKIVRDLSDKIGGSAPPEAYHRLRRAAKKFRYTLDFFAELYGQDADRLIERLKELQDILGARQDALILGARLRDLSYEEGLSKEARETLKEAMESCSEKVENQEDEFKDAISNLFGKRWKDLKQAMTEKRRDLWAPAKVTSRT